MESQKKQVEMIDLEIVEDIQQGAQGLVSKAKLHYYNQYFAVKTFKEKKSRDLKQEIYALVNLQHNNIISLCGFDEEHIILEYYAYGDMIEVINQIGRAISEAKVKEFAFQIMSAIKYMHGKNWVHRDVKLENMLLSEDGQVKISDFGNAERSPIGHYFIDQPGTKQYQAPEIYSEQPYCARKADIFAAGVSILTMILGKRPFFQTKKQDESFRAFNSRTESYWKDHKIEVSTEFQDLISEMLEVNPESRFDADRVLEHSWFKR